MEEEKKVVTSTDEEVDMDAWGKEAEVERKEKEECDSCSG